jgi:hypothetical protein
MNAALQIKSNGPSNRDLFAAMDVEMWFQNRLLKHGYHVFRGATTPHEGRERIRLAILDCALDAVLCGTNQATGKAETYEQAFERFYGEPLKPKTRKERT